jgi:hypothetical protein
MELNVKIHSIGQTQKVSDTFSKREFVVETQEDYKQYLLLQVVKDKCDLLNNYKPGDSVSVSLNFKGRLWSDANGVEKCFNTLECWKITKVNVGIDETIVEQHSNNIPDTDLPF